MKFTGKLKGRLIDCHTILFKSEEDFRQAYDELKDYEKLTLEIKPYRAKRSLDANSYLWVLLDKLAEKLDITRWQAYLNELKSHGAFEYIPLREKDIYLAQSVFRIVIDRGAQEVKDLKGRVETLHTLQCYKGSSKYNTKEMSRLIKGVLEDCREIGIPDADLLTPDEKEELKEIQQWKWKKDEKTNTFTDEPVNFFDDAMAMLRYSIEQERKGKVKLKTFRGGI